MNLRYLIGLLFVLGASESSTRHRAAVVTNGYECSELASQVLRDGGTAADAAITALLCEGVTCPQSAGIGGGFLMTIFTAATGKVETLNAREVAPIRSSKDMYANYSVISGARAVAVPGEVKGYWELHQKYGKLEWSRLFRPVIELCRRGHVVSPYLTKILRYSENVIRNSPTLAGVFVDPTTNDLYKEGDYIKRLKLAETLEEIATKGAATLYDENGVLAQRLIADIQRNDGIMTMDDLTTYKVRWQEPITQRIGDDKIMHTSSLPGSGSIVAFIMNVLNNYLPDGPVLRSFQRIAETFKYAYAKRTHLGDSREGEDMVKNLTDLNFAKRIREKLDDQHTYNDPKYYGAEFEAVNDHGTAHINILAPNGDAIAVTSSINDIFGCKWRSNQTGIILNDSMNDFGIPGHLDVNGLPPAPSNFVKAGKRPLSSMSPTIVLNRNGNVELVIGSAGGARITTSVSYVLMRYLFFNESIWDAVRAPRIHHQLTPMTLVYENGFADGIVDGLRKFGHVMEKSDDELGFASLTAIGRSGDKLVTVNDLARGGSSSVF